MRLKNGPQLPGAGGTRAVHHHGSHTPTSPGTILVGKMAITPNKSAGSVSFTHDNTQEFCVLSFFKKGGNYSRGDIIQGGILF